MITEFTFFAWFLGLSVPLYWLMPATLTGLRQGFLAAASVLVLWMLSPFILVIVGGFAAVLTVFAWAAQHKGARRPLKRASWLIFAPLVLVEIIPVDLVITGLLGPRAVDVVGVRGFALLGLSYTAIRCFIMCRECLDGTPPRPVPALLTFVFFGSFVAGPITGSMPFRTACPTLRLDTLLTGFARVGWGAAVFLILRQIVADTDLAAWTNVAPDTAAEAWVMTYKRLAVLYLDFAGYSEIAIGTALLFGITLPENFRYPFLARSLQEFWQRWHLSLGAFIGTYLFKPLVRQYGKPTLAIFLAFTIVGLWHRFALPYLFWGVGHGALLAWEMARRKKLTKVAPTPSRTSKGGAVLRGAFGWAFTMTYVAVLSSFATRDDIGASMAYMGRLVGL